VIAFYVAMGSSPPLAYCTIFVTASSEVVDLHIGICICTSHCLYLCMHALCAAASDPVSDLVSPVLCDCGSRDRRSVQTVGAISVHFSSQTLLNKDRQCCESWREVKLRVHVCGL